jgi:6-phosphogluconolactonase
MKIRVLDDSQSAVRYAAAEIAQAARNAIRECGQFSLALSGGSALPAFSGLAEQDIPWAKVHIFQVDERIVPMESPARSFAKLREILFSRVPLPEGNVHPMPVETDNLDAAIARYEATLSETLGTPPVLDLVHLGLGPDGHTASLIPGDPDLEVSASDVAVSGLYEGTQRMTLTYPILNRARAILWLVLGEGKAKILQRLMAGDTNIPAGRIERSRAIVFSDKAAASSLKATLTHPPVRSSDVGGD